MPTIDLRWVIRRFLTGLPRLLMALVSLIWAYYFVDYFVRWGYRVGSGLKLIEQKPFGGDFSYYWLASQMALAGNPAAAYDPARLHAALAAFFGLDLHFHFFYPPSFLLVVLPFALLPYHASLAVWLLTPLRRIFGSSGGLPRIFWPWWRQSCLPEPSPTSVTVKMAFYPPCSWVAACCWLTTRLWPEGFSWAS